MEVEWDGQPPFGRLVSDGFFLFGEKNPLRVVVSRSLLAVRN